MKREETKPTPDQTKRFLVQESDFEITKVGKEEVVQKADRPFPVSAEGGTGSLSKANWDEDTHPRDEHGRFGSGGGDAISAKDADRLGVSPVLAGKITEDQVSAIKDAIDSKADQETVLKAMEPIYSATEAAGTPTLILDKDGNPPDKFFEEREYRIGGDAEKGPTVGVGTAIDHLEEGAKAFAGPDGPANERTATILLGPSAAGKSTFAEKIALDTKSAIVDSDEAKKVIPGYNGGLGANEVHEESSQMGRAVEARLTSTGANVVIPTVGGSQHGIETRIDRLKSLGYKVHVVDVRVSKDEATRRMAARALRTGRPIGADYVRNVGDKPTRTYEAVKARADGYARINADGPRGSDRVTEVQGLDYLTAGEPILGKSDGGGGGVYRSSLRGGAPGNVRPQEGLLEKVAKPKPPLYADPLRPFAAKIEKRLVTALSAMLTKLGRKVSKQVQEKLSALQKADYPDDVDIDALLESLDLDTMVLSQDDLEEAMQRVARDGGKIALSQIGQAGVDEGLVEKVNERALAYARERAADLVGVSDDPEFALTDSTRDMLRATIAKGIEDNLSTSGIGDLLEESFAFSEERAQTIAAAEITSANSMGALAGYSEASDMGVQIKKSWLVLEDGCDICQENADAGAIELEEEFPSGDLAPGAHPHCRCVLVPEVDEGDGEALEDLEDEESSDD